MADDACVLAMPPLAAQPATGKLTPTGANSCEEREGEAAHRRDDVCYEGDDDKDGADVEACAAQYGVFRKQP